MSLPVHFRAVRVFAAIAGLVFVSACELGLQAYQQSSSGGCENWQAGCPIAVDFNSDGPALTTRSDVRRDEIVDAAATTEVRVCPGWPNTCPVRIIGDVIEEQYFFVF
jgi:hypothetical protein